MLSPGGKYFVFLDGYDNLPLLPQREPSQRMLSSWSPLETLLTGRACTSEIAVSSFLGG